ncbi:MAG: head-tail joining protein [Bacteroidota bacterium]
MNFVRPFFRANPLLRPCTVTFADGSTAEIWAIFDRENTINTFGDVTVQNFAPMLLCATEDVPGIDNNATVVVHYGYLKDEAGNIITDEAGERIIAENEFTYYVKSAGPDSDGFTELTLSKSPK